MIMAIRNPINDSRSQNIRCDDIEQEWGEPYIIFRDDGINSWIPKMVRVERYK